MHEQTDRSMRITTTFCVVGAAFFEVTFLRKSSIFLLLPGFPSLVVGFFVPYGIFSCRI